MGALVRRTDLDLVCISFFVVYISAITGYKLYLMVFREGEIPTDWASNLMRKYAFYAVGGIFLLIILVVIYDLIGFIRGEDPWQGMQEYTCGLAVISGAFSYFIYQVLSLDAAFLFAIAVFGAGMVFGLSKIILSTFSLWHDQWNIGLILLLLYLCALSSYSVRYQKRRRQNEQKGDAIKDQAFDEYLKIISHVLRYPQTLYYYAMVYWVFQIEEYLETHEVGWAAVIFYYVIAAHFVFGCCREFRENDF
ncbi:unnamed protein product [Amoebophrya sp. A25]|nr:unnamed protein product [Amoebophrya sp. A25]|eukprot:GSA25T00010131001.1